MSDLFDLPFEDDAPIPEPAPAPAPPAPRRRVLSVTELTVRVRDCLEGAFAEVWVEGELSNCRVWNTGHCSFRLKDDAAQLGGILYRSALRYLRFKPADGLRVVARGRISVYEPRGEYQMVCEHMEPQGLGALQLAFEQLKERLQAEGLFDPARKRPLPALPRKIGIVTSLDGAAIRDIINVLRRRYANAHLIVRPARVQGEGAAAEIARGLRAIVRVPGVDVVIVGRGGGSIEDLWAFNEEPVARAIAHSPVPVISAVGHETDVTIADFVADLRAPTPSAAAELVVAAKDQFSSRIDRLGDRLRAAARRRVQMLARRVHAAAGRPAFAGYAGRLASTRRRMGELARQLEAFGVDRRLAAIRSRLAAADGRMARAVAGRRHRAALRLGTSVGRLETLSPLAVLGRGYAVAWNADRTRVLRDAAGVAPGDALTVTLAKGELDCEVRRTR
ncbi:MAG: exodeoxyribonuclease VII large subunit [Acidobacteria bacterium]|nr:exodeoxyribonuclease VII large subunit [Acidobacteriota bacterium]